MKHLLSALILFTAILVLPFETLAQAEGAGKYPQASSRQLTDADFAGLSARDLKIMRNEIYARHGYEFSTRDMKDYFAKQSWYRSINNNTRATAAITELEHKNIQLIKERENALANRNSNRVTDDTTPGKEESNESNESNAYSIGKYPFTATRKLTESDLRGLSEWDLKIMRNEIYARHGYTFSTNSMKEYFGKQEWYYPKNDNDAVLKSLSEIENYNIMFIRRHE